MGAFSAFIGAQPRTKSKAPVTAPMDPPSNGVVNGPYTYATGPSNLGVGVMNLALERMPIPRSLDFFSPRYNIKKDIKPLEGGGVFPTVTSGPTNDLRANGVYLSGALQLMGLTANSNQSNGLSGTVNSATGTVSGTGNTQG